MQRRALSYVSLYPGITGAELDDATSWPSAHKRLTELADMKLVKSIGTRHTFGSRSASRVWVVSKKGEKVLR
tara:strand:- start:247 stop:462 length:216 start_codon:yes stop_codon:yes gene_type:complete